MPYRVGLCTLGCKVSQYETEAVSEAFESLGFIVCPFSDVCDVYVINTCTVTAESDRKSRQFVRRAIHANPGAVVMVMGCSSQNDPEAMARIPGVSYVIGTDGKMTVPREALRLLSEKAAQNAVPAPETADEAQTAVCGTPSENTEAGSTDPCHAGEALKTVSADAVKRAAECHVIDLTEAHFEPMSITRAPRTRAYVKIEDGCECRCSYCAIPAARGPVRSKSADDVISEIRTLAAGGTREVVLTGIEIASWGRDLGSTGLADLLERLDRETEGVRFRLGSLTPELLSGDFPDRVAALPSVVPHFHLSIQSGCDTILRAMRRRYNTAQVKDGMARLRRLYPRVRFTCDLMVGFPGETDDLYRETVDFLRQARFMDMHIFIYSPRPDTVAATLPDRVPADVSHARSQALAALRDEIQLSLYRETVAAGQPIPVLFETREGGVCYGHADDYSPVRVCSDTDLHAQLHLVRPLSADGEGIVGALFD